MANLRDHILSVPAGAIGKIQHNLANYFKVKVTNAIIPVLRIDQGERLVQVKQGDAARVPNSFTQLLIENTNGAVDLELVITVGIGEYVTNDVSGTVLIGGGTLDNITNPVQIIAGPEPQGCIPIKNCLDPDNLPEPLIVQQQGQQAGQLNLLGAGTVGVGAAGTVIAPSLGGRQMLIIACTLNSPGGFYVNATSGAAGGIPVFPGQHVELPVGNAVKLIRMTNTSATYNALEVA